MAGKSQNFKNVLHSRSQTHLEGMNRYDISLNTFNDKQLRLTERSTTKSILPEIKSNEENIDRKLENNYTSEESPVKSLINLKGNISSSEFKTLNVETTQELQTYNSRLSSPEKTPSLYKNLSIPQILVQQKKFAQMGKLIMECKSNPRFKEHVNLDTLSEKDFLAKEIIEKFRKEDEKRKLSHTFKYKRKNYEDSVVLNSTPAAYCPNENFSHSILVPIMKCTKIKEKSMRSTQRSTERNISSAVKSTIH